MFILNLYFDFGSVISAGIIGTLASFLPSINKESYYLKQLPAAFMWCIRRYVERSNYTFYCSGRRRWNFSGLVFMLSKNLFVGMGGKLGV
jgi:hypothetical protein